MKYLIPWPFFLWLSCSLAAPEDVTKSQIEFLQKLVSVSSGTNDTDGVYQVQNLMTHELQKIGFLVEELPATDTSVKSKQIVATKSGSNKKFITFITHADTVFEKLNPFEISADGKRIKGSGVGDDKGGMAVGLFAIQNFILQNKSLKYSLRFVISPNEETGSMGYRENLKQFAKDSVLILGLEPALENGSLVEARKGVRWYHIKVKGLEAHAGVSPETGINACAQLALFIQKLTALNDFKIGNTVSIGRIEGGKDKFNIVCGSAEAKVDVRFIDDASALKIHQKIVAILKNINIHSEKTKVKALAEFEIVTQVPPFPALKKSQKWLIHYKKIIQEIEGKIVSSVLSGGAADLNYMSEDSAILLDGLGPIGGGYHTDGEYIELPSLASRTKALTYFLNDFSFPK